MPAAEDTGFEVNGVQVDDPAKEWTGEPTCTSRRPRLVRARGAGVPAADPAADRIGVGKAEGTGETLRATDDARDAGYW